jgi:hypothetical protein
VKTYPLKTLFDSVLDQDVADSGLPPEFLNLIETLRPQFPDTPEVDALLNWITRDAAADSTPAGDPSVVGTPLDVDSSIMGQSTHATGISVSDEHPFGAPGDSSVTPTAPAASGATWNDFLNLIDTLRPQFPDTPEVDALLNWITRDAPAAPPTPAAQTPAPHHAAAQASAQAASAVIADPNVDLTPAPETPPSGPPPMIADLNFDLTPAPPSEPANPQPVQDPAVAGNTSNAGSVLSESTSATGISVSDQNPSGLPGDSSVTPSDAAAVLHSHEASWFMI